MGDDDEKGGTKGEHGGSNKGEVDEWMDLGIKAVSLFYNPTPRNRFNDRHLKTEWQEAQMHGRTTKIHEINRSKSNYKKMEA